MQHSQIRPIFKILQNNFALLIFTTKQANAGLLSTQTTKHLTYYFMIKSFKLLLFYCIELK